MKKKRPSLDALNQAYGLDYWSNRINAWEDFPSMVGTINAGLGSEFSKFQRQLVTDFLTWQAASSASTRSPIISLPGISTWAGAGTLSAFSPR